jgi:hypothetical protein
VLPCLSNNKTLPERTLFWRLPRPNDQFGQKAARRGKWKYVYDREMELLFDLEKDNGEKHNLAFQHPNVVKELRRALIDWETQLPASNGGAPK